MYIIAYCLFSLNNLLARTFLFQLSAICLVSSVPRKANMWSPAGPIYTWMEGTTATPCLKKHFVTRFMLLRIKFTGDHIWAHCHATAHFKESALWVDYFYKSKCPYVCLFVCVCVCPSHFLTPFNGLFAPSSQSPMFKLFRFSESLGKSNGKKWSQI